jgi:CubicO group peptidase (beta-lactamase class C family)
MLANNIPAFLICFICLSSSSVFGAESPQDNEHVLLDKLNLIFSEQQAGKPGVSVMVKQNNEIVYQLNKGLADQDNNVSIDANTGFRIGSMS